MRTKQLTLRLPLDLHRRLSTYATQLGVSMSSVAIQAVAKAVDYHPKPATPRSWNTPLPTPTLVPAPTPVPQEEEEVWEELRPEDYAPLPEFTEEEMADLQRRAAAAPIKPVL